MASAVDKAIAALTSQLMDGATVQLTVPRTEADTLVAHALPSLAALCRVAAVQDWFAPEEHASLIILGDIDLAVELVRRTRTRTTSPDSAQTLRSLELRIAALHTDHPVSH
ncbi:hypothetical protein [Saccharothrix longispora]|uniref:hypothetical protein n=1 Tax=Saccharothrix longispora TaxID=33920 RepID=UPI0028FD5225|nr:hypothetical protein [Saccharothrix longispora]MDU0292676.1 hypothetical protein [Saccharothrix longispora]